MNRRGCWRVLGSLMVLLGVVCGAQAETVSEAWKSTFPEKFTEGRKITVYDSNTIYVAGILKDTSVPLTQNDIVTLRYDALGHVVWSAQFNGPAGAHDRPRDIFVDRFGFVYVVAETFNGSNWDYLLLKYNPANGALVWSQQYDAGSDDFTKAGAIDMQNNIYITGNSCEIPCLMPDGWRQVFATVKFDSDGNLKWEARDEVKFPFTIATHQNIPADIAIAPNGNIFITGISEWTSHDIDFGSITTLMYRQQTDTAVLSWKQFYDPFLQVPYSLGHKVVVDKDNDAYVLGDYDVYDTREMVTIKYNTEGLMIWSAHFKSSPAGGDRSADLAFHQNHVHVTGYGESVTGNKNDFLTLKYRMNDGIQVWMRRFNQPDVYGWFGDTPTSLDDQSDRILLDAQGNIYVAGSSSKSWNDPNSASVYKMIKYDPAGTLKWVYTDTPLTPPSNGQFRDSLRDAAIDPQGNLYMTGLRGIYEFVTIPPFGPIPELQDEDILTVKLTQTP